MAGCRWRRCGTLRARFWCHIIGELYKVLDAQDAALNDWLPLAGAARFAGANLLGNSWNFHDAQDAALDDWLPLAAVRDFAGALADGLSRTMGVVCPGGASPAPPLQS